MKRAPKPLPDALAHKRRGVPAKGWGRYTPGTLVRGVVLDTYRPDDPNKKPSGWDESAVKGVVCDVMVTDPNFVTVLRNVPIMLNSAGLNDYVEWSPRPTSQSLDGSPLSISPEGIPGFVTKTNKMDGDHVVIAFMGNDLNQPVIVGQLPHPDTKRRPSALDATKYKWRRYLRGISFAVTDSGDVEINLSAASDGTIALDGTETPTGVNGNMTITQLPGTKVSVVDSVLSAPEPPILGTTYLTDLQTDYLTPELTFLGGLSTFVTGLTTAVDITAVNALATTFAPIVATWLAAQPTLSGKITASLGVGLPHLSSHLEID